METAWRDFRFAIRTLLKKPVFTLVVVSTLALGIGANTAIFSVVNGVVLKALPYERPEQLVAVWNQLSKVGLPRLWFSEPEFFDYLDQNTVFQDFAVFAGGGANLTGADRPTRVSLAYVSGGFFPLLKAKALMGRVLSPEDDRADGPETVALSYSFWRDQMGRDPEAVGKKLTLDGTSVTVIGVLRPDFRFQQEQIDVWTPFRFDRANLRSRGSHYLEAFARLKPQVTLQQAQSQMDAIAGRLEEQYPHNYKDAGWGTRLSPAQEEVVGEVRPALLLLLVAVGLVLLIACVNVANLMLVRGASRVKEIAIRNALGATRGRMIRQLLTESCLLSLGGGSLGLALAFTGLRLLKTVNPGNIPRLDEVSIDAKVLGFTLAVSILTGVIFGVVPAFQAARQDPIEALKEGGRDSQAGARRGFLRGLAVVEVALSLALLVGAGLMLRGFSRLADIDPGFRTEHILTFKTALPEVQYPEAPQWSRFYRQLTDRIQTLPGVEGVGAVSQLPLSGAASSGTVTPESPAAGYQGPEDIEADRRRVTPGYFAAMGIELVQGRFFNDRDVADSPPVAIIDTTLRDRFWPNEEALGKRIKRGGRESNNPWLEIVGVVAHVKHSGLDQPGREQLYAPVEQWPTTNMVTVVRTTGDPTALTAAVRGEVASLDRQLPLYADTTMSEYLSENLAAPRFNVLLLGSFAVLALILAAIGVYGVMSYSVAQRLHEIGIRIALGASQRVVTGMVLREVLGLALIGGAVGLALSIVSARWMEGFLYGISSADPWTYVAVSTLLICLVALAALVPARRAGRVDPISVLRQS